MTRTQLTILVIGIALLWASRFIVDAGGQAEPADPEFEVQQGDRALEAGAWWEAARHYRRAFALEDPREPARVADRASHAQQAGIAYVRIATAAPGNATEAERRNAQHLAEMWLEQALRLQSVRGRLHYERALVFDRVPESLRDPERARAAYADFLRWVDDPTAAGRGKPQAEDPAVARARRRLAELGG